MSFDFRTAKQMYLTSFHFHYLQLKGYKNKKIKGFKNEIILL